MSEMLGIVGWKNSGKTTLVAALVAEFTHRGLLVSTVKHAHHAFQLDQDGTDTAKHRKAGAHEVAIVSNNRWAIMHEIESSGEEPSLHSMVSKMAPCDLIIVEGYKNSSIPQVEVLRAESTTQEPLWKTNKNVFAVASDQTVAECVKPQFNLDDVENLADYITQILGLRT